MTKLERQCKVYLKDCDLNNLIKIDLIIVIQRR